MCERGLIVRIASPPSLEHSVERDGCRFDGPHSDVTAGGFPHPTGRFWIPDPLRNGSDGSADGRSVGIGSRTIGRRTNGSRTIGPRTIELRTIGPRTIGPRTIGRRTIGERRRGALAHRHAGHAALDDNRHRWLVPYRVSPATAGCTSFTILAHSGWRESSQRYSRQYDRTRVIDRAG